MRLTAIVPALCALVAIVLSFLCMFAGDKADYLESYHILTLNTSRIGQNILNDTLGGGGSGSGGGSSPLSNITGVNLTDPFSGVNLTDPFTGINLTDPFSDINFTNPFLALALRRRDLATDLGNDISNLTSSLDNLTSTILNSLNNDLNSAISSIAKDLGLKDFYSAHLMDYCWGTYTPQAVANASVPSSEIHKNVSACSPRKAMYWFDPTQVLNDSLANSTLGIDLTDLDWPDSITKQLHELRTAWRAAFVCYILGIAFAFLTLFGSLAGVVFSGRLAAWLNLAVAGLAFIALLLASSVITAVAVQGTHAINKFGQEVGVSATKGHKLMAVTWAAMAVLGVAVVVWGWECWAAWRRVRRGKGLTRAQRRARGKEGFEEVRAVGKGAGSPRGSA